MGVFKEPEWESIADNKKMACDAKKQQAVMTKQIQMPVDGSWSEKFDLTIMNMVMPKIYYFVVMDCEHKTHHRNKVMPKIEFEFEITNRIGEQYDHFSFEDEGTLGLHLFLLILYCSIFGLTMYSYYQY